MAVALIRFLFIVLCVSLSQSATSVKDYINMIHIMVHANLNEEDLTLDVKTYLLFWYKVPRGRSLDVIKKYSSRTMPLPHLLWVTRRIRGYNRFIKRKRLYRWRGLSYLKLKCRLRNADNFPKDSIVCRTLLLASNKPVRCRRYTTFWYDSTGCTMIRKKKYQMDPSWLITGFKETWKNRTFQTFKRRFFVYEVEIQRRPYYYWIRVALPFGIIASFSVAQLLIPVTRSERLILNVFILLVMQNIFGSISIIPVIGKFGGGARLGNLVTALLGINAGIFVWSISAGMLLSVLSATPLPHKFLGLIDWLFDKLDLILLAPSLLVQREESKAFTRRGDWFKLFLLIDRILLLIGIIVTIAFFNQYYK